jgi:hypothetical protein
MPIAQPIQRYSLKRREKIIELEDADGEIVVVILREMIGPQREEFENIMSGRMTIDANGNPVGTKDARGLASDLISRHAILQKNGQPINAALIDQWPSSTQVAIAAECAKLSGLDKKAQESAKNA